MTTNESTQMQEIRAGSNFVSQNPLELHFGLGSAESADVTITWPDGAQTSVMGVAADQLAQFDISGLVP